jgi:hypothetical protein
MYARRDRMQRHIPASRVPDTDVVAAIQAVGTFAVGQSGDGRHLEASTAAVGSFAAGQADEDRPSRPRRGAAGH